MLAPADVAHLIGVSELGRVTTNGFGCLCSSIVMPHDDEHTIHCADLFIAMEVLMSCGNHGVCVSDAVCTAPIIPFITGGVTAGDTLTAELIENVMYQWVRDLEDIPGATGPTYVLSSGDVGHLIRVRMHFTDFDNCFHSVISKPIGPTPGGAVINAGTFSTNASTNSITVQMPADIVPGNLLVVWMGGNNARTANPVAGWTFIQTSIAADYAVAYRIADGSEGSSVNFTFSGTLGLIGQAFQISGANSSTPMGAHNTNVVTGTMGYNAGISVAGRSIVLGVIQTTNNQALNIPSGWNSIVGGASNSNSPFTFGARTVYRQVPSAGSSGSLSLAVTSTDVRVSLYEIILA